MNKKILFAVAAAMTLGLGGVASADTVSISGGDVFTSTTVDFSPSGPSSGGVAGTGVFAAFECTSCADLTGSTLSSSFSGTVFSASDATDTIYFNLNSGSSFSEVGDILTITGSGELYFDGAPLSTGNFVLTTQDPGDAYTFSATVTETPLPSTWTMLIASLLGLGLFAYRGSKRRSHGLSILAA